MARQMKDSGIEWIGEIPAYWSIHTASQLFTQVKNKNEGMQEDNLLSLSYGKIIKKSINTTEGLLPESFEGYNIIEPNDIVLRLTDLQNDHTSLRVGLSEQRGIITSAYLTLRNESDCFERYLYYQLHAFDICKGFYGMGAGVRQGLNWDGIKMLKIVRPTVAEQHRIAAFLDRKCAEIDAVIERTKATIEEYKKLKQTVITEAVTKGVRGARKMKDSGIEWIGEIPTNWKLVKLKSITTEIGDGLHATPEYDSDGDYYFVNGNCIGGDNLVFKKNTDKLNEKEYTKYKAPMINCCTIMIALNGTYGKTSFYNGEKVLLGKSAGYITLLPNINKRFVRFYLSSTSAYRIMELSLCGTTIPNLSLNTLRNFPTPIPSDEEMDEIVSYLDEHCARLDTLITKKTALLTVLETYKKSLIYEYVTGKKDV